MIATRLDPVWQENEEAITSLLPLAILSDEFNLGGKLDDKNMLITDDLDYKQLYKTILPDLILEIYCSWSEHRKNPSSLYGEQDPTGLNEQKLTIRTAPKVGCNDQCPCGSGVKFKKCCGSPERKLN